MINTFDVKVQNRPSDVILESLNRFYDAKASGALTNDELSKIIILFGDLFANKIKQGKVTKEEIDSVESYLSGFIGANKDKYFNFMHQDLDRATKSVLEGNDFAIQEVEQRMKYAEPVIEAESYDSGFKKLGLKS